MSVFFLPLSDHMWFIIHFVSFTTFLFSRVYVYIYMYIYIWFVCMHTLNCIGACVCIWSVCMHVIICTGACVWPSSIHMLIRMGACICVWSVCMYSLIYIGACVYVLSACMHMPSAWVHMYIYMIFMFAHSHLYGCMYMCMICMYAQSHLYRCVCMCIICMYAHHIFTRIGACVCSGLCTLVCMCLGWCLKPSSIVLYLIRCSQVSQPNPALTYGLPSLASLLLGSHFHPRNSAWGDAATSTWQLHRLCQS